MCEHCDRREKAETALAAAEGYRDGASERAKKAEARVTFLEGLLDQGTRVGLASDGMEASWAYLDGQAKLLTYLRRRAGLDKPACSQCGSPLWGALKPAPDAKPAAQHLNHCQKCGAVYHASVPGSCPCGGNVVPGRFVEDAPDA
jgi:hypothetical protein